jgi:CubicO group peptidase (beta-lactamase class C family)
MTIPRRSLLALAAGGAATAHAGIESRSEGTPAERDGMAQAAHGFMSAYDVPGLAVAIARRGTLVYEEAFGVADRGSGEALTPAHRFRIASVSKPITAAAVFTLIEQGRLRLSDRVFGPGAVLGVDYGAPPFAPNVDLITIEHLLTHTAGGWPNDGTDPMFLNPTWDHKRLITETLQTLPLPNAPGTAYAYSNFGYSVLGRVIEKITGQSYEAFTREAVLRRCAIDNMRIGGGRLADRMRDEVRYHGQSEADVYTMNVRRMDSHGGWIATASELVRFATHVDGFTTTPNILRAETIRVMTMPSSANSHYAKGWSVNQWSNWWHGGSLPGTETIMVRTHSQFCWAALTNTRRRNSDQGRDLDRLIWTMAGKVAGWNA